MSQLNFEEALQKLNTLLEKMEAGNLPLQDSLAHFKEAMALVDECQKKLDKTEQEVRILIEKAGKQTLVTHENTNTDPQEK